MFKQFKKPCATAVSLHRILGRAFQNHISCQQTTHIGEGRCCCAMQTLDTGAQEGSRALAVKHGPSGKVKTHTLLSSTFSKCFTCAITRSATAFLSRYPPAKKRAKAFWLVPGICVAAGAICTLDRTTCWTAAAILAKLIFLELPSDGAVPNISKAGQPSCVERPAGNARDGSYLLCPTGRPIAGKIAKTSNMVIRGDHCRKNSWAWRKVIPMDGQLPTPVLFLDLWTPQTSAMPGMAC